MTYCITCS